MKDCPCCTLNMNNIHQQISLNSRIMIHNNYMRLRMKFLRYNSNCVIIFVGFLVNFCFVVTFFITLQRYSKSKVTIFLIARVSSTTRHSANSVKENPPANKRTKLSSNALSVFDVFVFQGCRARFLTEITRTITQDFFF